MGSGFWTAANLCETCEHVASIHANMWTNLACERYWKISAPECLLLQLFRILKGKHILLSDIISRWRYIRSWGLVHSSIVSRGNNAFLKLKILADDVLMAKNILSYTNTEIDKQSFSTTADEYTTVTSKEYRKLNILGSSM